MVIRHILKIKHTNMMKFIRNRPRSNIRQIALATGFTTLTIRKILIEFQEHKIIMEVFNNPSFHKRNFAVTFTEKGLKILNLIDKLEETIREEIC